MTLEQLIDSARALPACSPGTADAYAAARDALVVDVDRSLLARPDLADLIGPDNRALMRDNHRHHAEFIAALLRHYDPVVLTESVLWVFRSYRARGFQSAYWPIELAAWQVAMQQRLTPSAHAELAPLYRWLSDHCPAFAALTEPAAAQG
ncbi:hypothetical protein [uncultured Thiodictyon sp.]|uniref:hypothetical protein n=1 Tax=uncultured Thiodictyon sp. TaxID=1846217 RepID=UPI0025E8A3F1|nr:hypothetical protein [uncultured Thiodictyon sp.]